MKKEHIKLLIAAVVALAIGFFGGMEFKSYQVRSALNDAFSGMLGEEKPSEPEKNKPSSDNNLTDKVGLEITSKSFMNGDFQDANTFTFKFINNTDKDIAGVKGYLVLNDLFGDQIKGVNLSYDEGILAGKTTLYRASIDYNQFIDEDIKLRQTELSKLKYTWEVNTIIYADGTEEGF